MAGRLVEDADVVFDYLVEMAGKSRGTDSLPFTKAAIARATGMAEADVADAITKLDDEVDSHLGYVKVHLPETAAGNRVYRRFVKGGLVSRSAFAAMFLVLAAMYVLAFDYPLNWISEGVPGEARADREGAADALLYAAIGGLLIAMGLRRILTGHLHLERCHRCGGNVAISGWFGYPVSGGAAISFFLAGFPMGWAYWALVKR